MAVRQYTSYKTLLGLTILYNVSLSYPSNCCNSVVTFERVPELIQRTMPKLYLYSHSRVYLSFKWNWKVLFVSKSGHTCRMSSEAVGLGRTTSERFGSLDFALSITQSRGYCQARSAPLSPLMSTLPLTPLPLYSISIYNKKIYKNRIERQRKGERGRV